MSVLALDVGGSGVRGLLSERGGVVLERLAAPTGDRDPGLRRVRGVAEELVDRARALRDPVEAIAAGFPEYVDSKGALTSRETLDWETQPRELLSDLAEVIVIESDVRCGALGELHASGSADFLYLSLGTGISSSLVAAGRPRQGARGEAIAIGELPVDPRTGISWDGNLESFASGSAIARRFAERQGRPDVDGARGVAAEASTGVAEAVTVLSESGRAIGYALAHAVALLDPAELIIGGGLGTTPGPLHEALVAQYATAMRRPCPPPVRQSRLEGASGLAGATELAWSSVEPHGGSDEH